LHNEGSIFSHAKTEKINIKISVFTTKMHDFAACVGKVISDSDAPFEVHDLEPLLWRQHEESSRKHHPKSQSG
jgi:hypothetical protein